MRRPSLGVLCALVFVGGVASASGGQELSDVRLAALVEQALATEGVVRPQAAGAVGPVVDLSLEETVARALERNLDIAVERLNPQTFDLTLAQLFSTYRPTVNSTFGRSSVVQLPRNQLTGGQRVEASTLTYNGRLAHLLRRLHAQHADVRGPGARSRDDRRRLDRRDREYLPASRDGQER